MAKQVINVGTAANDKKGDSLRAAFQKVNTNFTELYTALGINADVDLNLGAFEFTGSVMSTTDSTPITIDQATIVTSDLTVGGDIVPNIANGGNLGSAAKPWHSLYVSNNTIYIGGNSLGIDNDGGDKRFYARYAERTMCMNQWNNKLTATERVAATRGAQTSATCFLWVLAPAYPGP